MKSKVILYSAIIFLAITFSCSQSSLKDRVSKNNLAEEESAYLKLHAGNPVNWQPWGEETLQAANELDKLVIISIGYVSCHWCHVMEEESFSDDSTAAKMNDHFVSVKVDREEQPGVDKAYMNAAFLINGSAGWPLNVIALPDGRPLFAGTYMTISQWNKLLDFFIKTKTEDYTKLEEQATALMEGLNTLEEIVPAGNRLLDESLLKVTADSLLKYADKELGGPKGAPKFPIPVRMQFQMHLAHRINNDSLMEHTLFTLDQIQKGGIYDHLAGGFFRYSTDIYWRVPHFEKMLYDNGQLISTLADAYKLTQDERYQTIIEETLQFVESEMSDGEVFYSSIDADSEGEEGKYYLWEESEIVEANLENPELFKTVYGIDDQKELDGKHVLFVNKLPSEFIKSNEDSLILKQLKADKAHMKAIRQKRVKPFTDQKVITSWNALMAGGYLSAYEALGDSSYLNRALKTIDFLIKNAVRDGHVSHIPGSKQSYLADAVFMAGVLIKAYENTFQIEYLHRAKAITERALLEFEDPASPYYYYSNPDNGDLIVNVHEINDNVIPGSNSQLALNLYLLGHYYYDSTYINKAEKMLKGRLDELVADPYSNANWGRLAIMMEKGIYEVAFTGSEALALRKEMAASYLPNTISLGTITEENLQLLENKVRPGKSVIYVCRNKTCRLPVGEVSQAMELMD